MTLLFKPTFPIVKGTYVQRVASQTITSSTATALSFDTETRDELEAWASSPNPTRLTAPTGGWYTISGYSAWAVTVAAYRSTEIWVNGAVHMGQTHSPQTAANRGYVADAMFLNKNDYVEIMVFQSSGANRTVTGIATLVRHS